MEETTDVAINNPGLRERNPTHEENEDNLVEDFPEENRPSRGGSTKSGDWDGSGSGRNRGSNTLKKPKDLEERKDVLNQLFGFKPFVGHIAKRPLEERSEQVRKLYEEESANFTKATTSPFESESFMNFGNVLYVFFFGWWLSLTYILLAGLLFITYFGIPYAKWCWQLKSYFFWPFGKFIVRMNHDNTNESTALLKSNVPPPKVNPIQAKVGLVFWAIFAVPVLLFCHIWAFFWSWFMVIFVPTAKINREAIKLLFKSPLQLSVSPRYPTARADVCLFTYHSMNVFYYKYTFYGINIILFNLFSVVVLTIFLGYAVPHSHRPPPLVIFFGALISIVPLAYMIGMAVSSISAQSSLALGAVLNATFGSVVELILYWTAIAGGKLGNFVQASITGSLLCTMLLIPGASMVAGGIKHKTQHFNQVSAGVSSVLLIISITGAFLPTVYYAALGSYTISCGTCISPNGTSGLHCSNCSYVEVDMANDKQFLNGARPLMYAVSVVLPLAYIIGLVFTLKTHAGYILDEAPKAKEGEGHDSAEWGKIACGVILLCCTALFAGISDLLTESVEQLNTSGLSQEFVGVLFIGVFGNAAELINAVNFGLRNNIALSLEIGNAGTIQTALIQIPGLVFFSAIVNHGNPANSFLLIFPTLNLFAIIVSVIIVNYISINGKTNYFEGASLLLVYIVLVMAFYFVPDPVS